MKEFDSITDMYFKTMTEQIEDIQNAIPKIISIIEKIINRQDY